MLAGALCPGLAALGQTSSDACSFAAGNRYPVGSSCVFSTFDKPTSFNANLSPATCGGGNNDDAFGWFTATSTTTNITYDPDDNHNPIMHLYSGTCASLALLTCANANGNGGNETITYTTTIGTNYLVRIQRSGTNNSMDGRLCVWSPAPPPPNDNCGNAIDLPVFDECFMQSFTNAGATASGTSPAPVCGGTPSTDVWFRFVAPTSGAVRIFAQAENLTDAVLQLYTGSCGALSLVPGGCDNDAGTGTNDLMPFLDRRCNTLTGGTTYYIRLWGAGGTTGTFGLCVYGPEFFPSPQQDCSGGFTVCNSGSVNNTSDWTGCTTDLNNINRGCLLSNERQGTWYYFSPRAVGNIGFTLQPVNSSGNPVNVDYDFALWGPTPLPQCPPQGSPIRCSYAAPGGSVPWTTGMAAGNVDLSEPATGPSVNGFVAPLTVLPSDVGQVYTLYLDNWTANGQSFALTWALSSPNQLDCSLLPVTVIDLQATRKGDVIAVEWIAQDAAMNERFIVEHSVNGMDFVPIGSLPAFAGSGGTTEHRFDHAHPSDGTNFYRLRVLSDSGGETHTGIVTAYYRRSAQTLTPRPNPASHEILIDLGDLPSDVPFEVRVHDGSGRLVAARTTDPSSGQQSVRIPVHALDAGYYLIGLFDRNGEQMSTGRFIKH